MFGSGYRILSWTADTAYSTGVVHVLSVIDLWTLLVICNSLDVMVVATFGNGELGFSKDCV